MRPRMTHFPRRKRLLASSVAVLALVSGSAVATAPTPSDPISVPDGDDTPVIFDIEKLDLQQNKDKRLQAKFTMYEAFSSADLVGTTGAPGSICLRVYIKAKPSAEPPEYLVCVVAINDGDRFFGSVLKESATGGTPRRVGAVQVTHPTSRTLIMRFAPSRLGADVTTIRFAGEATQQVGCPPPQGCYDRAPSGVRTRGFTLRK